MHTVLIVDDDKDTRDVLAVSLSAESWLVQSTENLLGALSILSKNKEIQCMLLDYNLPGMPMDEFLLQARAMCPNIGIVLISAADSVAEKAKKYGLTFYLNKPIDFEQLRKTMAACIAVG